MVIGLFFLIRRRRNAHSAKIEVFTPEEFSSMTFSAQVIKTQTSASLSYNHVNPSAHSCGSSSNEQLGFMHAGHQAIGIASTSQASCCAAHNQGSISTHGPSQSSQPDPPPITSAGRGVSTATMLLYNCMYLYIVTVPKSTSTIQCS